MQHTEKEHHNIPQPIRQNELLFTVCMVVVVVAVMFGAFVPRSAGAQSLNRLLWEAPPSVVADVLIRNAVDGRMVDARCLNARPEALQTAAMMQGGSLPLIGKRPVKSLPWRE
jgi:hypothetical protein